MKLKDLVVGNEYYQESSNSDWNDIGRRDIANRTGDHRVRLLGTEQYTRSRAAYRGGPAYELATKRIGGTYMRVLFLASESGHGYRWRQQDEEGYVTLASLRGEWARVVQETTEIRNARDARERERNEIRDRENDRLAEIAARAGAAGLVVDVQPPTSYRVTPTRPERRFTIKENDLVDFLNALTGTLESLTLVEH